MKAKPTSVQAGDYGESVAAEALKEDGFKIIARNVRTPRYEIDIIAKKKRVLYFVEVKYRSTGAQGKGYEYVTPKKLLQMQYAAQKYCAEQHYSGDFRLLVVSVDGDSVRLIDDIWT